MFKRDVNTKEGRKGGDHMTEADTQDTGRYICDMLHCTGVLGIWGRSLEVRRSFLQGPEAVLHVLQQLSKVCFDLGFAILHRVLKHPLSINRDQADSGRKSYLP